MNINKETMKKVLDLTKCNSTEEICDVLEKEIDNKQKADKAVKEASESLIEEYNKGNIEEARKNQNFAQDVIKVIAKYRGNIVAGKRIMKLIGMDLGLNRTPFQNISNEEEAIIKAELEKINFFEHCNK